MMILKQTLKKIGNCADSCFNLIMLKWKHVQYGKNMHILGKIYLHGTGRITIGDDVVIISSPNVNPTAGGIVTHFSTGENGTIVIGNRVGISHLSLSAHCNVTIEDDVLIGSNCMVADTDFHSLDANQRALNNESGVVCKPIVIKQHAFIGARSIILKGVTVGENSVVGAGSVVTKDIPKNEVWAGNPARFIRQC